MQVILKDFGAVVKRSVTTTLFSVVSLNGYANQYPVKFSPLYANKVQLQVPLQSMSFKGKLLSEKDGSVGFVIPAKAADPTAVHTSSG